MWSLVSCGEVQYRAAEEVVQSLVRFGLELVARTDIAGFDDYPRCLFPGFIAGTVRGGVPYEKWHCEGSSAGLCFSIN